MCTSVTLKLRIVILSYNLNFTFTRRFFNYHLFSNLPIFCTEVQNVFIWVSISTKVIFRIISRNVILFELGFFPTPRTLLF